MSVDTKSPGARLGEILHAFWPLTRKRALSITTLAAPASPSDGDIYIVPASGVTGDWVGNENAVAVYVASAWSYITPVDGDEVTVADANLRYRFEESAWQVASSGGTAASTTYDNVSSGLSAVNVQAAIDEIASGGFVGGGGGGVSKVLAEVASITLVGGETEIDIPISEYTGAIKILIYNAALQSGTNNSFEALLRVSGDADVLSGAADYAYTNLRNVGVGAFFENNDLSSGMRQIVQFLDTGDFFSGEITVYGHESASDQTQLTALYSTEFKGFSGGSTLAGGQALTPAVHDLVRLRIVGGGAFARGEVRVYAEQSVGTPSSNGVSNQTGGSFTPTINDELLPVRTIEMDNAAANTFNIPLESAVNFSVGALLRVRQAGAGTTTIQAPSGVLLNGVDGGSVDLPGQFSEADISKRGSDDWFVKITAASVVT